jgi:hypothetical protein
VHFSFKTLILRALCARKMSALSASGAGYARATRTNGISRAKRGLKWRFQVSLSSYGSSLLDKLRGMHNF